MIQSRYTWYTIAGAFTVMAITVTNTIGLVTAVPVGLVGVGLLVAIRPEEREPRASLANWDTDPTKEPTQRADESGGSQ